MRHPAFGLCQFLRRKQNEPAITQSEGPAGDARQPIHCRRAQPRTERAGDDDADLGRPAGKMKAEQIQAVARPRQMRRGWNDDLARQRQKGAFHRHQQHDERITAGFERAKIPMNKRLENGFEHGRFIAENRVESIRELRPPSAVLLRPSFAAALPRRMDRTGESARIGKPQKLFWRMLVKVLDLFSRRRLRPDPVERVRVLPVKIRSRDTFSRGRIPAVVLAVVTDGIKQKCSAGIPPVTQQSGRPRDRVELTREIPASVQKAFRENFHASIGTVPGRWP